MTGQVAGADDAGADRKAPSIAAEPAPARRYHDREGDGDGQRQLEHNINRQKRRGIRGEEMARRGWGQAKLGASVGGEIRYRSRDVLPETPVDAIAALLLELHVLCVFSCSAVYIIYSQGKMDRE